MVRLRSPLRELAGGGSHEIEGSTVAEVVMVADHLPPVTSVRVTVSG